MAHSSPLSLPPKLSEDLRHPAAEEDEIPADAVVIPATTPLLPVPPPVMAPATSSNSQSSPRQDAAVGRLAGSTSAVRTSLGKLQNHAGRRTPSVEHIQLPRWLYGTLLVPLLLSLSIGAFFIVSTHIRPHQSVCLCVTPCSFWCLVFTVPSRSFPPIRTPPASSPLRLRTGVRNQAVASLRTTPPASWCELCLALEAQRGRPCSMRALVRCSYLDHAPLQYANVLVVGERDPSLFLFVDIGMTSFHAAARTELCLPSSSGGHISTGTGIQC